MLTLLATLVAPPLGLGPAEGVVVWSEVTVLVFWFLLMALVGSGLGILHERTRAVSSLSRHTAGDLGEDEVIADQRIEHAA